MCKCVSVSHIMIYKILQYNMKIFNKCAVLSNFCSHTTDWVNQIFNVVI